jgi:hypothetical protein
MANGILAASQIEMLSQSGTGIMTIVPPATNTNQTLTLPDLTGTVSTLNVSTAVASTSGTSIDFTGIPAGVKRITVMFNGVSTNGSSVVQIQVGSGSFVTTGYVSAAANIINDSTSSTAGSTTGMVVMGANAASIIFSGAFNLSNISGNAWVYSSTCGRSDAATPLVGGGNTPTLSGALDRLRITTVNGTDTFDAGTINIMYEG